MKKRVFSVLLSLCLMLSLIPALGSTAGADDTGGSGGEGSITSDTYSSLGLTQSAKADDLAGNPLGGGDIVCANPLSELYVNFNAADAYGWSVQNNLVMQSTSGVAKGALEFYGADEAKSISAYTSNKAGALYADKAASKDTLAKDLAISGHNPIQYSTSVAVSPDTGKKNYVAELTVDSANQVKLTMYSVTGGKTPVASAVVCTDGNLGTNTSGGRIYEWEYDALFDMAAGDMNGDGYDEIAVYANNKVTVYSTKGGLSVYGEHGVVAPAGTSVHFADAVVALAMGDVDGDDCDEMVIADSEAYGCSNLNDSKVEVLETTTGAAYGLAPKSSYSLTDGSGYVRGANAAVGDINNDGTDELVIAGYYGSSSTDAYHKDHLIYAVAGTDSTLAWKETDYKLSKLQNMTDNTSQAIPPVALACAATQGMGFGEQVFLAGCLYSYDNGALTYLTQIMQDTGHKKDGGGESTMNEIWIGNVTVGNFTNSDFGQEQVVYTYAMKHADSDRYWYDVGYISKAQPGSTDTSYYYGQEQAINCDTCYNYDKNVTRYGLYLSLAAVDTDDDSTLMKFDGKSVSYTNPEVYAVLQASPYFGDLDEAENYVKSGSTSYQTSKSTSTNVTTSGSLSVGAFADFEQDFAVLGVKLATIKAEVSTNNTFSHSFKSETTKTVSIAYTGGAKDDYAVVYTVPYIDYAYNMWIPAQTVPSGTTEYDTWITNYVKAYYTDPTSKHSGSALTTEEIKAGVNTLKAEIKPGDYVAGQWQKYTVSVPLKPVTTIITVDAYDAVAEKTSGLDPIRGNILNSTPGEPSTYTSTPGSGFSQYGTLQTASSSASGASATVTYGQTSSTENSFNYDFSFDAKLGAGAGGVTVGVSAGFGIGAGGGWGSSNGVTYSGTVDNLPTDASSYFMNWVFGTSTAKLNKNNVIILCYKTSNVSQPPAVPTGLCVTNVTSNSVTLQWNKASGAAYYDLCYVNTNGYSLVKRLKANSSDSTASYTDTGLTPNSLHHYCVMSRSSSGDKSGYSSPVEAYTLDAGSGNFGITLQPVNTTVYSGGTAKFTVAARHLDTAGNTLTDVKYQWQYADAGSSTWKDCGGSNMDPAYSVSGITSAVSGRQYRCYVYVSDTLYLYSNAVTLTVGPADSTTALAAATGGKTLSSGDTVQSSYTAASETSYDPKQYQQVAKTESVGGTTYTCYSFTPSGSSTAVEVWKDSAGNYYTYDNNAMTKLTPAATQTLNFTDAAGTDVSLDITGNAGADDASWKATIGTVTYTSVTKYTFTGTNSAYTAYKTQDASGVTEWFAVKGSDIYNAEMQTSEELTAGGSTFNAANLQPVTTNGAEIKKSVETVTGGDTVTLTAAVTKQQSAALDGKVTFTVSNSDGTYYRQFTADGSSGTASQDWKPDTAGVYTITASYGSDTHYAVSASAPMTLYVVKPGESSLALSGSNITYGGSLTMAATELTGTEAKAVTPTAFSVTCDGAAVSDPSALLKLNGSNLTFTPDKAGTYVITVTYKEGSNTLTASKTVVVYDKTLTVTPNDASTFTAAGWAGTDSTTYTDTLKSAVTLTPAAAAEAGTYPVYAAYTSGSSTAEIDSRYTVVCKTGAFTLGAAATYNVTASCGGNGSVTLEYTQQGLTIDAGTAADIPAGASVVAVATPNNGYQLSSWTLDNNKSPETSDTLTVEDSLSVAHTVYAEFVPCAYTLTYGPKDANTGTVSAVYWDTDTNAATANPFSSGSKLTGFSSVQLTAAPAEGYYLKGWTTDDGATLIAPTGSTYLVSGLTADETVKAVFAQVTDCTVTVALKNGTQTVANASVSFNGTDAAASAGTYTFNGKTGSALTVRVTLPGGLIVTGWDGADGVGTLSASRKVLTISALNGGAALTVHCSTPNNYAVTTAANPASGGTITTYLNGSGTPAADLSAVPEASSIRFVAAPNAGYKISSWTVDGKTVTAAAVKGATDGSQEYTIGYLSAKADVTVSFAQATITFAAPQHGTLTVTDSSGNKISSGASAAPGSKITIMATPDSGYYLSALTVNGSPVSSGSTYTVVGDTIIVASFAAQATSGGTGGGTSGSKTEYTLSFDTTGGAAIAAITKASGTVVDLSSFKPTRDGFAFAGWYADEGLTKAVSSVELKADTTVYAKWDWVNPFTDVKEGDYFYDAVKWASGSGVTGGITPTGFAPDMTCTRAQAVTFLWRAAGSPAPKTTVMPFTDVPKDSYYYSAVLWAVENKIAKGTSDTTFSPDLDCSRAQIMTFLWRANGSNSGTAENPFVDVGSSDYYYEAVLWAVTNDITGGTSATTYGPGDDCTRAQIVTFIYREFEKQNTK